jgi:hypothetical protein
VNITGSGALYTGGTGVPTFGTLTIGASGTYSATSGTTTITGKTGGTDNLAFTNAGTFTHNNGTVLFDGSQSFGGSGWGTLRTASDPFYNFTVNGSGRFIQPTSGDFVVLNNLTVTLGSLETHSTAAIPYTVHGLTDITGNYGHAAMAGTHNLNNVKLNSGGTFKIGNSTMNVGSLRNLGGTVS